MKKKKKNKPSRMARQVKKNRRICFYEEAKNNVYCMDGEYHDSIYISYNFKTKLKQQKIMNRLIKRCNKCGSLLIDPDNFKTLKECCDGCFDKGVSYSFIPAVVARNSNSNKPKVKPFDVYKMNYDIQKHDCTGTPEIITRRLKNKDNQCILHFCKTCNKYYCVESESEQYEKFKIITIVDYDKYLKEKEVDEYIKNNFNKFISKEDISFSTSSKTVMTEEDYYRILSKIKNQNRYDFIIKGSTQYCVDSNHKVYEIVANVDVVDRYGEILNKSCPAYYCEDCNVFYIYNSTYENLRQQGVILCKIYDMDKFTSNNDYFELNSESILHTFGYNVNANENLTTFQRQIILKNIVDNNIMSKSAIINHLSYLYNRSKNLKNFKQACSRCKEDIDYISDYKNSVFTNVKISTLKKINYTRKK